MSVVAGLDMGKSKHEVVIFGAKGSKVLRLTGRSMYCKKAVLPEEIADTGIIRPPKNCKHHTHLVILAIGEKCGRVQTLSKYDKRKKNATIGRPVAYEVYGTITCPEDDPYGRIVHSPYGDDEFFIHDDVPIMRIER